MEEQRRSEQGVSKRCKQKAGRGEVLASFPAASDATNEREQHCWQLALRSLTCAITVPSRPLSESCCTLHMKQGGQ